MIGRLALGLLGGLGKGMMAAGGGKVALGLAKMALGGKGKGSGGRGGKAGGEGCGRLEGGRQRDLPLEKLSGLLEEREVRNSGMNAEKVFSSGGVMPGVRPESDGTAAMTDADRAALRCLAAHIVSFTDGRVRLRHPALRAAVPDALRRELLGCPGLQEVTFNVMTGSALLFYDTGRLDRPGLLAAILPLGRYLARARERMV